MFLIKNNVIYSTSRKEYFQYNLENRNTIQISLEKFCEYLFGKYNYKLRNLLGYSNSIIGDKIYSAFYQSDDLLIYDKEGTLITRKKGFFEGFTPYEIQVHKNTNEIWVATGAGQVVLSKNITTKQTTYQIGIPYEDDSELIFPEGICIFEDVLYISEMGNRKIRKMNMKDRKSSDYFKFQEPVWGFQKNEFAEIVLLDSGIYELKNGNLITICN